MRHKYYFVHEWSPQAAIISLAQHKEIEESSSARHLVGLPALQILPDNVTESIISHASTLLYVSVLDKSVHYLFFRPRWPLLFGRASKQHCCYCRDDKLHAGHLPVGASREPCVLCCDPAIGQSISPPPLMSPRTPFLRT